jgi:hypothetical protein
MEGNLTVSVVWFSANGVSVEITVEMQLLTAHVCVPANAEHCLLRNNFHDPKEE